MAITEVYVDPSIAADSGTGTIGDPYGDLEYAIEQTTFDTTNGTRVNIKAGTAEVLAAELSTAMKDTVTTPAWAPSITAPCVFQGYTSVAGDGGIAVLDGGGLVSIYNDLTLSFIRFINVKGQNVGTGNYVFNLYRNCHVVRCISDGEGGIGLNLWGHIEGCYVTGWETSRAGITFTERSFVLNNYLDAGGVVNGNGIVCGGPSCVVTNNIITGLGIGTEAISARDNCRVENNSIYSSAANTGSGIILVGNAIAARIANNLVEGYSGVGGIGIDIGGANQGGVSLEGNGVYNCTTAYDKGSIPLSFDRDNETLSASPFNDAPNGDFSPVDTGNVREGALPNIIGGGLV